MAIIALSAFVLGAVVLVATTRPEPWTAAEVRQLVTGLNEAAAIGVPHSFLMASETRAENLPLLQKVEQGQILTEAESAAYRKLYQSVLQQSQAYLARFDAELTVLADHAMAHPNNVAGHGIASNHDHHDLSARKNFAALLQSLDQLRAAANPLSRIRHANTVQKDLVDLISHIGVAAHTVSVPYEQPETPWSNPVLGNLFEAYLQATKRAQFEAVNSPAYWRAIDEALAHYVDLILAVQEIVQSATTPWERKVAGRFLSLQTLAPPVDLERPLRR